MTKKTLFGSIKIRVVMEKQPTYKVSNNADINKKYAWLKDELKEHFYTVFLNGKNRIIGDKLICLGTSKASIVDIQDIARTALLTNTQAVILIHNHPSGEPDASTDDYNVTQNIKKALALFEIKVLDHIIIGKKACISMSETGMLK